MRAWLGTLVLVGVGTAAGMQWWHSRALGGPGQDRSKGGSNVPVPVDAAPAPDLIDDAVAEAQDRGSDLESSTEDPIPADGPNQAEPESEVPGGAIMEVAGEKRAEAESLLARATASSDPLEQARLLTRALRSNALDPSSDRGAYELLLVANQRGLLNPRVDDSCMRTAVRDGDSLWGICKRLQREGEVRVTPGIIRLVNNLTSDSIYPGATLKVPTVPTEILVEKSRFRLSVFLGEILLRRYLVGLGENNRTPEGEFTIASRLKDPPWFKPGVGPIPAESPENILGTRWLGFAAKEGFPEAATFGIHGTRNESSIGKEESNGCVRMRNAEVEELFEWIAEGTRVEIRP